MWFTYIIMEVKEMSIIVQKFGGSSVADTDKLFSVCDKIIEEYNNENEVVVIVSAQGKTTDNLIKETKEISDNISKRELDVLLTTGEQKTISKLCMCLNEKGYKAVSLTGWQIPIITDNINGNARIKSIDNTRILKELENKNIVVIAGFQGIDEENNITTFGRGGSDTTAVAIAASLRADRCDIYTDVDGIYSSDPRVIKEVKKIDKISYDEMLELASMGAKVLHNRCVEIGKKYDVPIAVKSSMEKNTKGTLVVQDINMEELCIKGIAKDDNIISFIIRELNNCEDRNKIFENFAKNNISTDMIIMPSDNNSLESLSFVSNKENKIKIKSILEEFQKENKEVETNENLSKVSIIGTGLVNNPTVLSTIMNVLYKNNIEIYSLSTSEIKISILVDKDNADITTNLIHHEFLN